MTRKFHSAVMASDAALVFCVRAAPAPRTEIQGVAVCLTLHRTSFPPHLVQASAGRAGLAINQAASSTGAHTRRGTRHQSMQCSRGNPKYICSPRCCIWKLVQLTITGHMRLLGGAQSQAALPCPA